MADKEEITLEAYAKKFKSEEKKDNKKGNNTNKGGKNRIEKKLSGVKSGKSAIRRTGRPDNSRSGGKPRQNTSNNSNKQRSVSRPAKETTFAPKVKTVRPIPEHKKRIVKVYNLVPTINNEEFYNLFVKYGSIEQSKIETDKKGKSEEKGYVVYRDNEAAKRAIEDLNAVELEGRIITVEFMKDGDKLPERSTNQASGSSGSGERERERRNSDTSSPHGIQKRIFKDKESRFERRDNRNSGGRRDNNNNNRDRNRSNNGRRDFGDRNRRNNNGNNSNGNRNRNNNNNNNRNNRKFSR